MTGSTPLARPRARWAAIALTCLALGVAPALSTASVAENDPEAKLLRAEILELSRGDLDGAMAIYRELVADEATGDAVRAKALLQLAGCHRKRGELETARELLQRLVDQHAQHSDLIRVAQGYLREIEQGRSDNPTFDWIEELLASPEIQARIFDHAMALASHSDWGAARNQLRALGTLAAPTLDRLARTTQDANHRGRLALILIEMGRFDHMEAAVKYSDFSDLISVIRGLSDASRVQALAAVNAIPWEEGRFGRRIAVLRLACGAGDRISQDLQEFLEYQRGVLGSTSRDRALRALDSTDQVTVEAFKTFATGSDEAVLRIRGHLIQRLLRDHPEMVSIEAIDSVHRYREVDHFFPRLEELGRIDDIATLYAKHRRGHPIEFLRPGTRAQVFRAAGELGLSIETAFRHPETLGVATDALRHPESWAASPWGVVVMGGAVVPDPCFDAMASLLIEPDPNTVRIAAHLLGYARADCGPRVLNVLLDRLERSDLTPDLEAEIWATIFRRMIMGWDGWKEDKARLERLWSARRSVKMPLRRWSPGLDQVSFELTPHEQSNVVRSLSRSTYVSRRTLDPSGIHVWEVDASEIVADYTLEFAVLKRFTQRDRAAILEFWPRLIPNFAAGEIPSVLGTLFAATQAVPSDDQGFVSARDELLRELAKSAPSDPATRAETIELFSGEFTEFSGRRRPIFPGQPHPYLKELLEDPSLPAAPKATMLETLQKNGFGDFLNTLDWVRLLDDENLRPLLYRNSVADWVTTFDGRRDEFIDIAMETADGLPWAIRNVRASSERYAEILERGLQSGEPCIRTLARDRVLKGETVAALPLLWRLVADAQLDRGIRTSAIDRLAYLADASSVPPLTKLLDDSDFTVRAKALAALESIQETLKKQNEWREKNSGSDGK